MKKIFLAPIALSFVLGGCATTSKVASLPAEMKVDDEQVTTGMPNYPLSAEIFTRSQASVKQPQRAPASSDQELAQEMERNEKKPSLKRLYFRSLYQQWKEINTVTQTNVELKSCPQFHHDKVTMDEKKVSFNLYLAGVKPSSESLPYYPEWALPVSKNGNKTSMWHSGDAKLMTSALKSHAQKLKKELAIICEEGASDSYFRLENMVTYTIGKPEFQSEMGLKALLKIPAFSTMLLLKSVQGDSQAKFNQYDQELLTEVKGFQLQSYIVELKNHRQQLLKVSSK
ncbi:MAG: hypothetical protein K2P81_08580 [Bacteriovoracaceae bacterium]|nr:hypothetical protein [Bacteriovoracaceae bacterium]